jgi:hypothetical protein
LISLNPELNLIVLLNVERPETFNCNNVPTEVKEELVTPEPRVVEDNTLVPLISYCFPEVRFQSSLEVNAEALLFQVIVLRILGEPIPIPAPSRSKLVPTVDAIPTLLSASSIVVELI